MARTILDLDSRDALQPILAGGKGAGLARLRRQGFPVPDGFIVTPAVFQDHIGGFREMLPKQPDACPEAELAHFQAMIIRQPLPARLERDVVAAYRKLGGPVAVRSSMLGEDGARRSFAGQLETFLNVEGEGALVSAIKQCWAALYSPRMARYLASQAGQGYAATANGLSMAVVIQRMVDARAAGVAFSADPITGQRCVLIEAICGLGDSLVRGVAEPDRFLVDSRGVLSEVKCVHPDAPTLQQPEVLALAELVRRVVRKAQAPQDIEWAWDGARFHLLQARIITALVGRHVYSNRMVSEMVPGLIKPLVYSTNTVGMTRNVFGRLFTELIGPSDFDFTRLAVRIHSRIYTDITLLGELLERIGLPANFMEMVTRDEQSDSHRPPLSFKTARAMLRLTRFAWRHSRPAKEIHAFLNDHARTLQAYQDANWQTAEPAELLDQLDTLIACHAQSQWHIFVGPMNMMVRHRILCQWVRRRVADVVPSDLIRGLVGLKALEPNAHLQRLAALARQLDADVKSCLMDGDFATIRSQLARSATGRALTREVDEFLDKYGFLSGSGTDFTLTPWSENAGLIWYSIGRAAESPLVQGVEDIRQTRESARARVRGQLNWWQRQFFDRLLASTIMYIDLRERLSLMMSRDSYQMRRIILALAEHLVHRQAIAERDDVFYLTRDELVALIGQELASADANSLIAARQAEMARDAQLEMPDTICGDQALMPPRAAKVQDCLTGISGSSGWASGRARIILDPSNAPRRLASDDILVVPFSDVGWTPLFAGVSGIVAETGGQLSHTSIVAREYGIPAVVSVKQATRLIQDGQPIAVDGTHGRVCLYHLAELREEQ